MSSKEHKTPDEQVSEELKQEQELHTEAETQAADVVDPAMNVLLNWKRS